MENQEWFRDIENTMSDYLNEYMNNNAPSSSHRYYTDSRTREDVSEHRLYLLINEFQQDYYTNMRLYQENMRDVIQLLREFRATLPQNNRPNSFSFPDVNTAQQPSEAQPVAPQPTQQTTERRRNFPVTTTSFAYFIQPLTAENNNQPQLTNAQIEHAVEQIIYDTSMSNAYNENTANTDEVVADRCPICLEDFQIGEQVLRIRVCGHVFKRPGLLRWFQRNDHCPVCRRNVNENPPSTEEPSQTQRPQTRSNPNHAINHLLENHLRNPLIREFGSFIQTMAQNNRQGSGPFAFFDFSFNEHR
jgi:hypothetical protein